GGCHREHAGRAGKSWVRPFAGQQFDSFRGPADTSLWLNPRPGEACAKRTVRLAPNPFRCACSRSRCFVPVIAGGLRRSSPLPCFLTSTASKGPSFSTI